MNEIDSSPPSPAIQDTPAASAEAAERPAGTLHASHASHTSRFNPWLIVAALALALSAWQWFETRLRLADTQQELARRLAEIDGAGRESRLVAQQARDEVTALQARHAALEAKLQESQSQQAALENLYQELARSRDDSALAELEQGIALAAQQLQLAGNVQGATLVLQAADARLSGAARPQFIALRKAIGRDLDRLRALPQVDAPGLSLRIETVIAAIDALPFAVDARPHAEAAAGKDAGATTAGAWRQMASDLWRELRTLVRIQRFDRDEPALLAPGQDYFLRENFKLRLLNARLALLARDQWTYRNELKAAHALLVRHFDARDKAVQSADATLRQLAASEVVIELPTLNDSLSAIRSFRSGRERDARDARR